MRDRNKIKKIISTIEKVWNDHPNLRLGQMLINGIQGKSRNTQDIEKKLFYIEDDDLVAMLENLFR